MLAGTETSLTYEININFTNKPQNLKLYIDENMKNELYIENDVLSLKDFLSLEDEKEVSKIIYWNWAEETGDTEDEIHENDLKDSEFMGKKLQMAISVTGKQEVASNNNYYYMVTLDANGGKIGSSSSVQKQVVCGESYGELPIPTREGYIFAGWTDKNLLGLSGRTEKEYDGAYNSNRKFVGDKLYKGFTANNYWSPGNLVNYEIDSYNNNITIVSRQLGYGLGVDISASPNTNYVVNCREKSDVSIRIGEYKEDGTWIKSHIFYPNQGFTTSEETRWLILVIASDGEAMNAKSLSNYNIQLEKGSIATPFEPFQIVEGNSLVEKKNAHILTARWIKNGN